jgi:hypothetical protein
MNLRLHATRSLLAAIVIALGASMVAIVVTRAMQSPPEEPYSPYGISPQDATAITDPEKKRLWEEDLAIYRTARAGTPRPRPSPYLPPYESPVPEPTGFVEDLGPGTTVSYTNAWYGEFAGQQVTVLAGYSRYGALRGVLMVTVGDHAFGRSLTGTGPLRVVRVGAGVAHIEAEFAGDTFVFDFATMALSAPTAPAVSPTPLASGSPNTTATADPVASTTAVAAP